MELITCVDMETNKQLCRRKEALAELKDSTCVYLQGMGAGPAPDAGTAAIDN